MKMLLLIAAVVGFGSAIILGYVGADESISVQTVIAYVGLGIGGMIALSSFIICTYIEEQQ